MANDYIYVRRGIDWESASIESFLSQLGDPSCPVGQLLKRIEPFVVAWEESFDPGYFEVRRRLVEIAEPRPGLEIGTWRPDRFEEDDLLLLTDDDDWCRDDLFETLRTVGLHDAYVWPVETLRYNGRNIIKEPVWRSSSNGIVLSGRGVKRFFRDRPMALYRRGHRALNKAIYRGRSRQNAGFHTDVDVALINEPMSSHLLTPASASELGRGLNVAKLLRHPSVWGSSSLFPGRMRELRSLFGSVRLRPDGSRATGLIKSL